MRIYWLTLLFSLAFELVAHDHSPESHKLIVLISTPRSLSSVFYRMMEARGDCTALSEPGVDAYTLLYTPQFADEICDPISPKTFAATEKKILDMLNCHQLVFMKEMGYAASKYLLNTPALRDAILNQAHCVFLIRDPHQALISFYKKFPEIFAQLSDWVGYDRLYEFYQDIKKQSKYKPLIILADELASNPSRTIEKFCAHTMIPFDIKQLSWTPLAHSMPTEHVWNNAVSTYWFDRALGSTHFDTITKYEIDDKKEPTFNEISNLEHREVYKKIYATSLIYYKKFVEESH